MKPTSVSPSKGKLKESTHWHSGWWDFYPLMERPHRPLQWSHSSVIFSAHPTQPLVTARHFSSPNRFVIPSPKPVGTNQNAYEPPTIISVAPGDDWLFAYFPKSSGEGTGCLWKRGSQIDNWIVQEYWTFPPKTAPIASDWLGSPREWTVNSSGKPDRLPPKSFTLPTSGPALILVTQDYRVHICYYQYYLPNLQILKCPLGSLNMLRGHQQTIDEEPPDLVKLCTDATIGISYNAEHPIFIAARLRQFTRSTAQNTPFDPMDLTVPMNTKNDDQKQDEWDSRNDECVVEINQVHLRYDGAIIAILVQPLAPLPIHNPGLFRLDFLSCSIDPPSDVAGSVSLTKKAIVDKGKLYLALSYLNFEGYISSPKSQLSIYSINRRSSTAGKPIFGYQFEATRTFAPSILTYIASRAPHLKENILPVVLLDTSGQWSKTTSKKPKNIPAGTIRMLNLPGLEDKADWEPSVINIPLSHAGRELPLQGVASPNGVLLYTTSLSSPQPITATHLLPVRDRVGFAPLSLPLVVAILNRRSPADVCHRLSLPSVPPEEIVKTLSSTMTILDVNDNGLKYGSMWDILGVAVEIYRKRASLTTDEESRAQLTTKWHTAHDMCSIVACNMVFVDCANGDTYDLDAVWQLIGLSNWIITLLDKIMKECVLFRDIPEKQKVDESQDDLFGPASDDPNSKWEVSPILVHLVHPFALQNLVAALKHIKKFHQYLKSMSASAEQSQIAKDLLIDSIDCSGINLEGLETVLDASIQGVGNLPKEDCRIALASCQPTQALESQLSIIVKKITETPNVLNKAILFIKPEDLADGVTNLSLGTQKKYRHEDVVTKGVVMAQEPHLICSRCGGSSNVAVDLQSPEFISDRWRVWERMWSLRCICGGSWVGGS